VFQRIWITVAELPSRWPLETAHYPQLTALVRGEHGEELRSEILQLLAMWFPDRAARHPARVIAKLLRNYRGQIVEESVVLRDISESGMRITLPAQLNLSFFEVCSTQFRLRVGQGEEQQVLTVDATLVRIAAVDKSGANLAYRFEGLSDSTREVLLQVQQWTSGVDSVRDSRRTGR
jgi:PilZ domain